MQSPISGNADLERRKTETKVGRPFQEKTKKAYLTVPKSNMIVQKTSARF